MAVCCLLMVAVGLHAQRYPLPEPYDRPPYRPYDEVEQHEETGRDYPCALVVPGLPGKSAAVDRPHYAK